MTTISKKIIMGFVALITAIAIAFIIMPLHDNMANKVTEVVFLKDDLPKGAALSSESFYRKSISLKNLPKDIIKEDVKTGMLLNRDLKKGDFIRESDLIFANGRAVDEKPFTLETLDGNYGAIAISFSKNSDSLKGKLKTGDIISLISLNKNGKSSIASELKYLYVLSSSAREDAAEASEIIVLGTERQAQVISDIEETGIKTFLVYRGNYENAKKFLKKEEEFLKKK
jgi:pilus assembly protein CpaB